MLANMQKKQYLCGLIANDGLSMQYYPPFETLKTLIQYG